MLKVTYPDAERPPTRVWSHDPAPPERSTWEEALHQTAQNAYSKAYHSKLLKLNSDNAGRAPLPVFKLGDQVLYYQH